MALWSGRLSGNLNETVAALNNSLSFDQRLAEVDISGSIAWAKALQRAGVLTLTETDEINRGLQIIQAEFIKGEFEFKAGDEDIHTAVERRLTELIGPLAGKLHTGRSRNDQVATDFRLWILDAIKHLDEQIKVFQTTLLNRAERDFDVIMPGYTHFQQAQPILLSHWWLSHFWALQRDRERLQNLAYETACLPLGSGALAGTGFPIDRFAPASELGFVYPSPNSIDAVSDRDFAAGFLFCTTLLGVHLSRLAEALILYSTSEFGFITLADEFSTGSSLMPQKKNPDPLELTRAKAGVLIGRLTGLLSTLKALPSAYDKDLQEDKPPVFDAADTLEVLLPVLSGLVATLTVNSARMRAAIDPQVLATDLADYLVNKGVPFRQAHHAVGGAVKRALELGVRLPDLPLNEWQAIHPAFQNDLYTVFDLEQSLNRRAAWGGAAPQAVKEQLVKAREAIM